ncbi:MAG: 16S rRNA (cytosine(1402)-N(4))-methyltransferase RsmH, partial [Endomicrobiia bacterium]
SRIFKEYGEEKWARRIAQFIVNYRTKIKIEKTTQLVELVLSAIPKRFHSQKIHPATRIFQALRIEVNNELNNIKIALYESIKFLRPSGRIVVISFHSLEDRIVKHFFLENLKYLKIITKKPIQPSIEEIKNNPNSRSAKLRVAEKL